MVGGTFYDISARAASGTNATDAWIQQRALLVAKRSLLKEQLFFQPHAVLVDQLTVSMENVLQPSSWQ